MAPHLGKHPYRKTATGMLVAGIALSVIGIAPILIGSFSGLSVLFFVLGACLAYTAVRTHRQLDAVLLNNAAFDLVGRGRISEAEALLDAVSPKGGHVRRAVTAQRAQIALRRADARAAEEHANALLATPVRLLTRDMERTQNVTALGIRAVARASLGKSAEALEDICTVRASEMAPGQALAQATVAEAILLAKSDDRPALARLLQTATPLFDDMAPRERALLRALRRMIEVRQRSVYREPARPSEMDREEPLVGEWVSKIVPEAAAFVPEAERVTESKALATALAQTPPTAPAGSQAITRQSSRRLGGGRLSYTLSLSIVVIVLFLTVWQFLTPAATAPEPAAAPEPAEGWLPLVFSFLFAVVAAGFIGLAFGPLAKARRGTAALREAMRALLTGDTQGASRTLSELVSRGPDAVAAAAQLQLSVLAERACSMSDALALCDSALARVSRQPAIRALNSDILVPELIAERALLLAALGDEPQSSAELATLAREHPTFAFMTRSVFRVRLVQSLRRLDHQGAVQIARDRTPELPLSRRDEMLADIVLLLSGGKIVEGEVERIAAELSEDRELAAWIDFMAPNARAQLATHSQMARG